ncbi:hypothetical protein [Methanobrevibacter smithii]|uniref:hypothetical protein n=1 Tax=Methanobrevibacter smithii TaxID=2173 RepID=UPI0037DDD160
MIEMIDKEWIELGRIVGDTGPKGDTGAAMIIKGSYDSYEELVNNHPVGNDGDAYLVDGWLYVWDESL